MNLKPEINNLIIQKSQTILSALKQMDLFKSKLLLVFSNSNFENVLSIGDIQRAIIKNLPLSTSIANILRENTIIVKNTDSIKKVKKIMYENRIECMPCIDNNKKLVNVYFWKDLFGNNVDRIKEKIHLPVIIMAGGKGTRLKPITNIIPKPLIPLGEKTIIEDIMDRFITYGCHDFFISVNYKAETIKHYFSQLRNEDYKISYFQEDKPLGTAGSLFLIRDRIKSTFFVSNCDIIIDEDYTEILKFHKERKNELSIVSALKHYSIPYGTIRTGEGGGLTELIEKPELTFQINTGMYILEPHLLDEIPENEFFHITDLIHKILKRKGSVGVFPVSDGSWIDIGKWDEYINTVKH